jgi:hypothetical protein
MTARIAGLAAAAMIFAALAATPHLAVAQASAGAGASPPAAEGTIPAAPRVAVASGVDPAEVTVGDPFRSVIRIEAPADVTVEFPEQLGSTDAWESLGPVTLLPGEPGDPHVAVYPLVAWQTGDLPGAVVPVYLRTADGAEHVVRIALPLPAVRPVLPADTAGVEPRGAKPVLSADTGWPWWWLLLGAALLVVLLAVAARRWMAGRATIDAPRADLSPRERALAELERARRLGAAEAGDWKPFFSRVSGALRDYLASVSPRWGADLTTAELLRAAAADGLPFEQHAHLAAVLRQADLVKFARVRSTAEEAEEMWGEAHRLVSEIEPAERGVGAVAGGAR